MAIAQRVCGIAGWKHRLCLAVLLLAIGELLILIRIRPASDFYFPFVWLGYILLLDATVEGKSGWSLWNNRRKLLVLMFPLSAGFWWVFELLNQAVQNWVYVGSERYTGLGFVAFASLDFSTVLPAVWTSALFIQALVNVPVSPRPDDRSVPGCVLIGMFCAGVLSVALPILWPRFAFGLIWCCCFFLLDPINCKLGRPSMIAAVWRGKWRLPLTFSLAALMCGIFWEAWNFWSMPKWIYHVPYVGFWHVFEMPLLGYSGYLPFGLELFAMTAFVLPLMRVELPTWELSAPERPDARQAS